MSNVLLSPCPSVSRARKIYEKALPPDHPFVVDNLRGRAEFLRAMGDTAGAEALEAQVRAIQEKAQAQPQASEGSQ
jgi:hypothetical protein